MTCSMDLGSKFIVMVTNTKECLSKDAEMVKEHIITLQAKSTKEVG